MDMNPVDVSHWFRVLAQSREGLPLELVSVLPGHPRDVTDDLLAVSLGHMQRVFAFGRFSASDISDPEAGWTELKERLDDSSYYAALLMPFLRQVLECRPGFIAEVVPESKLHLAPVIQNFPDGVVFEEREQFVQACGALAKQFNRLRYLLADLSDADDFSYWCRSVFQASSILLLYAAWCSSRLLKYLPPN